MKRKICVLSIVAVIVCLFVALSFSACQDDVAALQFEVKYVSTVKETTYFLFHKDGSGYFVERTESISSEYFEYLIKFKYTYVDKDKSAIMCFFDEVVYSPGATEAGLYIPSNWSALLTISKNVLCTTTSVGVAAFVNENYLDELPNFDITPNQE